MFYTIKVTPKADSFDFGGSFAVPQIALKHKDGRKPGKIILTLDLYDVSVAEGHAGISLIVHKNMFKVRRDHARYLALFLNSYACTKALRKAFLSSIKNPEEKGRDDSASQAKPFRSIGDILQDGHRS
jgi:hypothetical protein